MKSTPVLIFLLFCTGIVAFVANKPPGSLEREIPDSWRYASFDDAVHLIEQKTGFKVSYPNNIADFMRTMSLNSNVDLSPIAEHQKKKQTVRLFLDGITGSLVLKWEFDPANNTVALDLPWKITDPRTPAELVHFLYKPGDGDDCMTNPKWPVALNALLSLPANLEKAWRVREESQLQDAIGNAFDGVRSPLLPPAPMACGGNPVMATPITATNLQQYIFVMICQPIMTSIGHGSVSYYWFKDDGTLMGAGLMNTGHRVPFLGAAIDKVSPGAEKPSELQFTLGYEGKEQWATKATFVLGNRGLLLKRLGDEKGEHAHNMGAIGDDLMEPAHTSDDFIAQYLFLKVHFDGITPEVDDASGVITGFKANITIDYPPNMRLVSSNPRFSCAAKFEDEHGDEKKLDFDFEELAIPDALIQKYKLKPGYHISPKGFIDWKKDTETKK